MIKKLLLVLPIALFTEAAIDLASNSAPASSSGAPGETDCTTSGCHDTYKVNEGPGNASIIVDGSPVTYVAGQTYTVHVTVNQANLVRFGFQLVALDGQNQNVGVLTPIDNGSNQVTRGYDNFSARRYMTYTYESTLARSVGMNEWVFKWTAPQENKGKITFYLAGLAADNNGNDAGDHCYTRTTSLSPEELAPSAFNLNVYPNPASEVINVNYSLTEQANVKIELLNSLGQIMQESYLGAQMAGEYSQAFNLTKEYGKGMYTIRFIQDEKVTVKKIMLAK